MRHHKYKCMLMVDNDDDNCFFVKCYQERMRLASHFYAFKTGKEAMDFITRANGHNGEPATNLFPDVILVDISMPEMSGYNFLNDLKHLEIPESAKPKIFVLAETNRPKDISRAGKFDIDGYFVKPFTNKQLHYLAS